MLSVSCSDLDFMDFLKTAKESAVDSIEFKAFDNEYLTLESSPEEISMFNSLIKGNNIKLSCIFTDIILINSDVNTIESNVEKLKSYVQLAKLIDCKTVGVTLGHYPPDTNRYFVNKNVVYILNTMAEVCKGANIDILIHTDADVCRGETLYPLFRDITSEHIGMVWDADETYKGGESFEKTYRLVGKHIKLVHVTDRKDADDEYCEIGKGILNLSDLVKYIIKEGYDGTFSLKWHKSENINSIDFEAQLASFIEFMRDIAEQQ